ncbi:MAG: M20/M25/M40 family metallo-hydrolase [Planctomycetaceae bacterium]
MNSQLHRHSRFYFSPTNLSSKTLNYYFLILICFFCCGIHLSAAEKTIDFDSPAESLWLPTPAFQIDESDLKQHIGFLASDAIEGRESGSQGGRAASAYIVSELQKYGLKPGVGENEFYQEFGNGFRNILAILPAGNDANKQLPPDGGYVVIGAHYDHVGYGNSRNSLGPIGQIHNGADDNASGTALLLELAQALASLDKKPSHPILFAFWDAEERGLVGSKHWVANSTLPLDQIRFYFNYDMVGRMEEESLEVYGIRTYHRAQEQLVRHNHDPAFRLIYNWDNKGDSDHYPFINKRIPYLMLHTGKHEDYHRPSDDAHLINYKGLTQLGQLSARLLWEEANRLEPVRFRREYLQEDETLRKGLASHLGTSTLRLGLSATRLEESEAGFLVKQISPNSPASQAGLNVGDVIIRMGDVALDSTTFESLILKNGKLRLIHLFTPPSTERKK